MNILFLSSYVPSPIRCDHTGSFVRWRAGVIGSRWSAALAWMMDRR
jgi:hypothetical protein